ncbi:MAG: glycosyltransferase family 4 protein [Rhodospirillales bacterium]|jgi:glycosyltransferase involved in cell wall biosynthesis|nr:glycosyltransferase family 4 protein [Rhodospirillales bacterium]|tara:strand:- start:714 stop:1862 length:1149 start_codon:yes stop_codon:yes gene_type:complete
MSESFKVNVSVHGRWHAFELANGLYRRGHLGKLLTTYPRLGARRFLDAGVELRSRPLFEFRRRLYQRYHIGVKPDLAIARGFAKFAATEATTGADLLVGWSSSILEAIAPAKGNGLKVVVERGSTHICHQSRILRQAYDELGMAAELPLPEIVEREVAEYEAADAIAVPTEFAAQTFTEEGVPRDKLVVNGYGVDLSKYAPASLDTGQPGARVLFVGRIGVRKGVPWLLRAIKDARRQTGLDLVGPIEDGFREYLRREKSDHMELRGAVSAQALPALYSRARIFCLPSLEEGMPLTLLQAMAAGLPVVTTAAASGGIVEQSGAGIIVPPRDSDTLAEALDRLISEPDLCREMGRAGRSAVESGFGWPDYADRAIGAYRRIIS